MNTRKYEGLPIVFQRARADHGTVDNSGRLRVTLSTETAASDGHVIVQNGWDLSRYRGAFLWEHNRAGWMGGASSAPLPPIGRVEDLEVVQTDSGPELQGWIRFFDQIDSATKRRAYPLAYQLAEQFRGGFLTDVSVGFVMLETQPRSELPVEHPWWGKYGLVSRKTLLLELSAVIFGADAGAGVDLEAIDGDGRAAPLDLLSAESVSITRAEDGTVILRITPGGLRTEPGEHTEPIELPEDSEDSSEEEPEAAPASEEPPEERAWFPGCSAREDSEEPEERAWFPGV
jgi:hypothetical protein